jgi:hypothetical protein
MIAQRVLDFSILLAVNLGLILVFAVILVVNLNPPAHPHSGQGSHP